jgi:uncharacterized HAD superfamily protein
MKHFCIDIDNTIAESDKVMRRVISEFTGGKVELEYDDIVTFNYYECRDRKGNRITKEEWSDVHKLFSTPKYLMSIRPVAGALKGLRQLAKYGSLHFATSRLPKARKATIDWLEKCSFPSHDLHFLKHGEKHAALKQFTAAVEDDYDQAAAFAHVGETACFLIEHPWNRSRYRTEGVHWVKNWSELTQRLLTFVPKTRPQ